MHVTSSDRQAGEKLGTPARSGPSLALGNTSTDPGTRARCGGVSGCGEKPPLLLRDTDEPRVAELVLDDVVVLRLLHWDDVPPWLAGQRFVFWLDTGELGLYILRL